MAITTQKGLKFPKVNFQKKANGQTSFYSATETFTLPASANWDSNTLFAVQLDHLPALAREAIGQTIADPVLTCTTDSTTRTINYKRPDSGEPATGEVFLDIYNGVIQFNSSDASKTFSITYYVKGDLVDHNAMNRIWSAGASYIVGSQSYCDYPTLAALISAGVLVDYDSVKLMEDQTTTGLTIATKLKIIGNNRKIIKSGTATDSRAINFNQDLICEDVDFTGWSATGDVCLYASADVKAIITKNKNIGGTQLTNASLVCSYCIVENNLPFSENIGQATTLITNNVQNKNIKQYVATNAISVNDPVFLDPADPTKCKKLTTLSDSDIFLGFAYNNASIGGTVNVVMSGVMDGLSGLTAGKMYYLTSTATIASISAGSKPLPAVTSNFRNGLLGTSGTAYHSVVGLAISSNEIIINKKRQNNLTKIQVSNNNYDSVLGIYYGFYLNDITRTKSILKDETHVYNIFTTGGSTTSSFDTKKQPWSLKIQGTVTVKDITDISLVPRLSASLRQFDLGTTNLRFIESQEIFNSYMLSYNHNGTYSFTLEFKNWNPGDGEVRLEISHGGTVTSSGAFEYYFNKVDLTFL